MRYTPQTERDQERMLQAIGLERVEQLYEHISESLRARATISLPEGLTEPEVKRRLGKLASKNAAASEWSLFLGGGVYQHFIPSAVDALISRAEFLTSYTPYQPEVSQGTLQVLYEFQTLICQLTAMEVANAGVYDGASAAAEAVLLSRRVQPGSRRRVLLSRALHPQYRAVITTYLKNFSDMELVEIPFGADGAIDANRLSAIIDHRSMCVLVGYPNFFGVIEDLAAVQAACARNGAHMITVTTEPLALALLQPPGAYGVDIAVGEGQSLGVPMSLGGPAFGFFAAQKKFTRSLPGRLAGETVDSEGRRGFVLTLATREQHIRREKATSNICTSQTLCTTAATVYMSLLGKAGLRRVAEVNAVRAHECHERLTREAGLASRFTGLYFNEFVLAVGDPERAVERCVAEKIVPGIPLVQWYPELPDGLLVCVTEMNEKEEIQRLVKTISG